MSIVEILLIFWMSINVAVPVFSAMRGGYSSISVMFLWFSFREVGLLAVPLAIAITCAGGNLGSNAVRRNVVDDGSTSTYCFIAASGDGADNSSAGADIEPIAGDVCRRLSGVDGGDVGMVNGAADDRRWADHDTVCVPG
ncbi:hypothetical protein F8538_09325 [Edwardsiella ictaluri]|uniref:hypothetical protein n=1 Tax=Edwardsiella ictaluri TaxID=67780 RepID=UPI0018DB2A97|nr:hypothetical protein [Edwardsiella ictaluri]QPW26981.1 hypothetical protein F8538_09325 [Edwardsiella ictaluri]